MNDKTKFIIRWIGCLGVMSSSGTIWAVRAPRSAGSVIALDRRPTAPSGKETPVAEARLRVPLIVGPTSANGQTSAENLASRLMDNPHLFRLTRMPNLEIEYSHRTRPRTPGMAPTLFVGFVQKVGGLTVAGSRVVAIVKSVGGEDRLVSLRGTLYPRAASASGRMVSATGGLSRVAARLPAGVKADRVNSRGSRLYWLDGRWQVVQEYTVAEKGWRALVDESGGVRLWDDRHFERSFSGTVTGDVQIFDPLSSPTEEPLGNLTVTALPWLSSVTGSNGAFSILSVPENIPPLKIQLSGPSALVTSYGDIQQTLTVAPDTPNPLYAHFQAENETIQAQINGFFHTNVIQEWLDVRGLTPDIRTPVGVWTNIPDTCNAFYFDGNIHFFVSGDGCPNTAYDTVIYHEYGHLIDDAIGGIESGGLSEGWGDVLAVFVTGQPLIGENFNGGSDLRTADNNYIFDPSDEIHDQGQAWAGFAWHLREALISSMGAEAGEALAEDLVLPVFWGAPLSIPQAVQMVSWVDDDNGDLGDGTPHQSQINTAGDRHGFGDHENPTLTVTSPASGNTVSDLFTVEGTASDNDEVAVVAVTVDGEYTSYATGTNSWTVTLDPAVFAPGPHQLIVQAADGNANEAEPILLSLVFSNPIVPASYDPALKAPACGTQGVVCDSGPELNGRGGFVSGGEPHDPSTLGQDCPDGSVGIYHIDESLDRLRVTSLDGTPLAPGKQVRLDAAVWAYDPPFYDFLNLFYTTNAVSSSWNYLTTLVPPESGYQVLSTTFTLGFGSFQAVRGSYGYFPEIPPSVCRSAPYDDTDDLAFRTSDPFGFRPALAGLSPAEGVYGGGTSVTLMGANFEVGETVLVGGVPATSVEVLSSTRLRFLTPGGTIGPKDVTATNPGGQSATLSGAFTYRVGGNQTVSEGKAYPNPFRPDRGPNLTISPLPADSEVKIYSLSGELVREIRSNSIGAAEWDGRNESGESASSGVYLAHLKGAGGSKTIKLVIQR